MDSAAQVACSTSAFFLDTRVVAQSPSDLGARTQLPQWRPLQIALPVRLLLSLPEPVLCWCIQTERPRFQGKTHSVDFKWVRPFA